MTDRPQAPLIDQPAVQGTVAGASLLLAAVSVFAWWWSADAEPLPRIDGPLLQVDVNVAGEHELALLPEIGPATARAIVDDRTARGPFVTLDQLGRVRGIGPKTLEAIRPYVQFPPPPH